MTIDERIGEQLRGWVESGAARVTIDEIEHRPEPHPGGHVRHAPDPGRRRALVLVAATVVLVLASVVVFSSRQGSDLAPLVTDDVGLVATHHYRIEPADQSGRPGPIERAEYGGALHRGIVWTAQARLAAYGRTDAVVVPTASGAGAVVSTVEPLSDEELALLLGVQGELALAVVGGPTELAQCHDGPRTAMGSTTVAGRTGGWPEWGPVLECWSTLVQDSTYLGTTDEGDPGGAVVLDEGADVRVDEAGDRFSVVADFGSPPLAQMARSACGEDAGCIGSLAVALDGTIIQPPGGGSLGSEGRVIAQDLSRSRAESLRAVLVAGGYPIAVTVTARPQGTTPDPMRPWAEVPNGSAPPGADDAGDGRSGPNTLTIMGYVIGGDAPGAPRPMAEAVIEVVDADGTRRATTDVWGEVEIPVPVGTVRVSVADLGGGPGCGEPTTIIVLATGHHRVTLDCHIK